jgi:acyl-CoA dehydrogenase
MIDFRFDRSIQDRIRVVSSKYDLDYWKKIDRENTFPVEYWESLASYGLFGILIDERHGGLDKEFLDLTLAVLETARHYSGLGSYLYLSGSLVAKIFANNANEKMKDEILPQLAKGKLKISIALSEEQSGQDASSIITRANKNDSRDFLLNGSKHFVNNADLADYLIVFARTADASSAMKKSLGVSMFLVDAKDGKIQKRKLERLGMNFVNSFSIDFQNLLVESSKVLGEIDRAWYNVVDIFNMDRILTAASLIGTGRLALDEASKWANQRTVFGKPIGSNQGIQFPLADAAAQLETAEAMTLKAAWLVDQGKKFSEEASFALSSSVTAATAATDRALQTFGGHGYYKDHDVERFWRDVRAHKVHPISEELLLASIAERSLGLPKSY